MSGGPRRRRGAAARAALRAAALAAALGCAVPAAPPAAPLRDATEETGLDFVHFNGMSGELYFCEMVGSGAALFDYDGDGDLDAFFVQGRMIGRGKQLADALVPPRHDPPFADRLYRNDLVAAPGGGAAARWRHRPGATPERGGYGMGVAAGDYDSDGDPDLYVTSLGANTLLRNDGAGTFSDVTAAAGADDPRWSTSAAFADLDGDGWLDLFVVNYVDYLPDVGKQCRSLEGRPDYCGPSSYEPEYARLLVNRGDGTFVDRTLEAGIAGAPGSGLGVLAADFDGDRRRDVYVANDLMPNYLWRNQGDGTFRDEGLERGVALNIDGRAQSSMGVDLADVDGDGDEDLFMTHIDEDSNTLYRNQGGGLFVDATAGSRLGPPSLGYTGFGTAFFDPDLDGDLDLAVANGAVKLLPRLLEAGDPFPLHQPNQLFVNAGDGTFVEVAPRPAVLARSEVSRGIAVGDVDNDGDADLLITNNNGPARLALAEPADGHWLGLRLAVAGGPAGVPGARAALRLAGGTLARRVRIDGSFLSANDPRLLFGTGDETRYDAVEVEWPDGARTVVASPPADRYLVVPRRRASP